MQFDPANGTLYISTHNGGHGIYTLDTTKAGTTPVKRYDQGIPVLIMLLDTTTTFPDGKNLGICFQSD